VKLADCFCGNPANRQSEWERNRSDRITCALAQVMDLPSKLTRTFSVYLRYSPIVAEETSVYRWGTTGNTQAVATERRWSWCVGRLRPTRVEGATCAKEGGVARGRRSPSIANFCLERRVLVDYAVILLLVRIRSGLIFGVLQHTWRRIDYATGILFGDFKQVLLRQHKTR